MFRSRHGKRLQNERRCQAAKTGALCLVFTGKSRAAVAVPSYMVGQHAAAGKIHAVSSGASDIGSQPPTNPRVGGA